MRGFTKDRVLYGTLRDPNIEIVNLRCELHFNCLDTSNMTAELFDTEGVHDEQMDALMLNEVEFISKNDYEEILMNGQVIEVSSGSNSDRIGRMSVRRYQEIYHVHKNSISSISFLFHITPSDIFERKRIKMSHDMKGLLFGYNNWTNVEKDNWKEDDIWYDTKMGRLCIYPGLIFEEQSDGTNIVKEQLKAFIKVTGDSLEYTKVKQDVEDVLKTYLHMLSVLEGKFTNWFYCEVDARGEKKKGFIADIYKSVALNKYNNSDHLKFNANKYKDILPIIVEAYTNLSEDKKGELDKAIRQSLIASAPRSTMEARLIYWHSCLDILIHLAGPSITDRRRIGFSRSLVITCENLHINWNDLYSYITKDEIFSDRKADFRITTFRNNMIHLGIYPESKEYDEIFAENLRAAYLFERIFMRIIGVEYDNTPIGEYREFR
jgi:hypothetical protein